jgi:hypothetical protein
MKTTIFQYGQGKNIDGDKIVANTGKGEGGQKADKKADKKAGDKGKDNVLGRVIEGDKQ